MSSTSEKLSQWLQKRCPDASCPLCKTPFFGGGESSNAFLSPDLVMLEFGAKKDNLGAKIGNARLAAHLRCRNCGYVMLFDAYTAGIQ